MRCLAVVDESFVMNSYDENQFDGPSNSSVKKSTTVVYLEMKIHPGSDAKKLVVRVKSRRSSINTDDTFIELWEKRYCIQNVIVSILSICWLLMTYALQRRMHLTLVHPARARLRAV